MSFADSLLLKSDWTVGHYERGVRYTYAPERLLGVLPLVRAAFREELGLDMYAVLTQGSNEYDEASPLHVAPSKNHVSLNTLGLPFAQLISIDHAVRGALKAREHAPTDIYMDTTLFLSLRLRREFDREVSRGTTTNLSCRRKKAMSASAWTRRYPIFVWTMFEHEGVRLGLEAAVVLTRPPGRPRAFDATKTRR